MRAGKKNTTVLLALAAGALSFVVVIGIVALAVYWKLSARAKASQPASSSEAAAGTVTRTPTRKQLFLDNAPVDDAARAAALQGAIEAKHERCGSVDKVVMISSGVWTVRCAPDGVFRLTFGRDGQILSVQKF